MAKATFIQIGWTISLFFIVLYLVCLGWQFLLTDPALKTLHVQLLALSFPGFIWLTLGSFFWGLFLSFAYGWVGAGIFVWLRRLCCGK
jgi:hypothetical protein